MTHPLDVDAYLKHLTAQRDQLSARLTAAASVRDRYPDAVLAPRFSDGETPSFSAPSATAGATCYDPRRDQLYARVYVHPHGDVRVYSPLVLDAPAAFEAHYVAAPGEPCASLPEALRRTAPSVLQAERAPKPPSEQGGPQ